MTLYDLTGDYIRLMEMAEDADIDEETFLDTLEGLNGEIEEKAENYGKVIRTMQGDSDSIDAEIKRLTAKKKTIDNRIKRITGFLEMSMRAMGKQKIKTTLFSFSIQKNPPSVFIDAPDMIPEEFLIEQKPKPDNAKIKAYLKDNKADWAHLEQSEGLRIR